MGLEITREKVVISLERKDGDHLRLVAVKAKTEEGRDVVWHCLELGTPYDEGKFNARTRLTIRGTELQPLLEAMSVEIYGRRIPPGAQFPSFDGSTSDIEPVPEIPY